MNPFPPDNPHHAEWERQELAESGDRRAVVSTTASGLTMRAPRWLWDRRIPAGAITLIGGREGIGKSTIAYWIGARITRGDLPGRCLGVPRAVGVVAAEDDWACVILPRLIAAGADLDRVYRIEARVIDDEHPGGAPDVVSVPADLDRLAAECQRLDIALLIIDPLMSVIHGGIDTHKDREARRALDPLSRFAATTGVAVLGLIHVNKSSTGDPLNSLMASRAFAAVPRSILYCLRDPEAETDDEYLFGHPKSNLGPTQPTLKYHLTEAKVELTDPEPGDDPYIVTSRVAWDGEDGRSVRDAMQAPPAERPTGDLAVRIEEWVRAQGRTVTTAEIAGQFPDAKPNTVEKNLSRMVNRGTLVRPGGISGHYALPPSSDSPPAPDTRPDTPSIPSEVSEVSEVSVDQGKLTLLTELTAVRVSGRVSAEVSEDRAAHTQRDEDCCKGGPLKPECQLCKRSPTYWRAAS